MPLTLYASPGACSFAPHIVLEEIGAPFELVMVAHHGAEADTRKPAFQKMNPKGRVPVLADDEFVLTETAAILVHLASRHTEVGLMPEGPDGLARAVEWFNWLSSAVQPVAVRMVWRADFFSDDTVTHPSIVSKGHRLLVDAHALIEQRLRGRDYAIGDAYSIADPYLLVYYRWGNRMQLDMATRFPAWSAHTRRLEARPAVQRALAAEKISLWA
jgi:glutathione S-transferase